MFVQEMFHGRGQPVGATLVLEGLLPVLYLLSILFTRHVTASSSVSQPHHPHLHGLSQSIPLFPAPRQQIVGAVDNTREDPTARVIPLHDVHGPLHDLGVFLRQTFVFSAMQAAAVPVLA